MVSKLPHNLKYDWARRAVSKVTPNLEDFGIWVAETADAASFLAVPKFDKKTEEPE